MSKSPFEQLQLLVLDWAGTVVDHGSLAPAIVFREIFRQSGVEISLEESRGPMGMSKREHIAALTELPRIAAEWTKTHGAPASPEDVDGMYERFLPLQKSTLGDYSQLIEGVAETISRVRSRGLKIGSTTGYTTELMESVGRAAAEQGFAPDAIICSDHVPEGRPAPWMLLQAAQALRVYPAWRIAKVDDTAPGIRAARNAGAWAIGVSRTGNGVGLSVDAFEAMSDDEQCAAVARADKFLCKAGAHFVVESVADIESVLDEIEVRLQRGERPESIDHRR